MKATNELKRLQELVTWHPIRATGNTKYGPEWIKLYLDHGIESVWGRCYEQTFEEGNPLPIRITSYFNLPLHAYKEKILPELS